MGWLELLKLAGAGSAGAAITVAAMFINEVVVSGKAYHREREERQKAEARMDASAAKLVDAREQLARATVCVEKFVELVADLKSQIVDAKAMIQELTDALLASQNAARNQRGEGDKE